MNLLSIFNVFLLLYLVSFPVLIEYNKKVLKGKNKIFNQALKTGRKIHPNAGFILIITGAIHGYIKLDGQFIFHTGSLLLMLLAVNGIIGLLYKKNRKRYYANIHKTVGVCIVIAFVLHYMNPWFFS